MREVELVVAPRAKYFKIVLETNVEGFVKNPTYYTVGKYCDGNQVRVQVENGIYDLRLPEFAKVSVLSVTEVDVAECSSLEHINKFYKPLAKRTKEMKWRMEEEELRIQGCSCLKLVMFFKKTFGGFFEFTPDELEDY